MTWDSGFIDEVVDALQDAHYGDLHWRGMAKAALDLVAERYSVQPKEPASALRGEGPSPAREGKEPESPALSGLDAATVEACAKLADTQAAASKMTWEERVLFDRLAARIRALATPTAGAT